jgi:hypothetical protein
VRSEHFQSDPNDPFRDGSDQFPAAGVDLKYGLTSSLTLNATVNPDFGEVEVDPAVVNLSAFETFYPEKRPFFVEGERVPLRRHAELQQLQLDDRVPWASHRAGAQRELDSGVYHFSIRRFTRPSRARPSSPGRPGAAGRSACWTP